MKQIDYSCDICDTTVEGSWSLLAIQFSAGERVKAQHAADGERHVCVKCVNFIANSRDHRHVEKVPAATIG
jgi:hypothetical protein